MRTVLIFQFEIQRTIGDRVLCRWETSIGFGRGRELHSIRAQNGRCAVNKDQFLRHIYEGECFRFTKICNGSPGVALAGSNADPNIWRRKLFRQNPVGRPGPYGATGRDRVPGQLRPQSCARAGRFRRRTFGSSKQASKTNDVPMFP
jgi:hypothetical protein